MARLPTPVSVRWTYPTPRGHARAFLRRFWLAHSLNVKCVAPSASISSIRVSATSAGFRYVTLSTVGYGDFVARCNVVRMLSVTEALTGQLYLGTVVALQVSNLRQAALNRQQ